MTISSGTPVAGCRTRPTVLRRSRPNVPLDGLAEFHLCLREVVRTLEVHPEIGRGPEIASQPHRRIGRHRALAFDDRAQSVGRYTQFQSQLVHAYAQRL